MSTFLVVSKMDMLRSSVKHCGLTHPCRTGDTLESEDGVDRKGCHLPGMSGPHGFVVDVWMCFCWIICVVGWSGAPEVVESALGFTAA